MTVLTELGGLLQQKEMKMSRWEQDLEEEWGGGRRCGCDNVCGIPKESVRYIIACLFKCFCNMMYTILQWRNSNSEILSQQFNYQSKLIVKSHMSFTLYNSFCLPRSERCVAPAQEAAPCHIILLWTALLFQSIFQTQLRLIPFSVKTEKKWPLSVP